MTDETENRLIEQGVRMLILHPEYVAFQIVMTGMLTYSVFPCTSRPPEGKFGSIAGLGYKNSCGHEWYFLADWGDRISVVSEYWEEGTPFEGQPFYYTKDQRKNLIRQFRAAKKGKKLVFSKWEKKCFSWDNYSAIPAMVRKGGPSGVAWFPKEYRQQVINEARQVAEATLKRLGSL